MKKEYYFVLAITLLWCMAIFITPLIAKYSKSIATGFYLFFRPTCHQFPERSFFLFGQQLPVCARCVGLYLGALLGVLIYPIRKAKANKKLFFVAILPLALDGLTQFIGLRESSNVLRLVTGLFLGLVAALFVISDLLAIVGAAYRKIHRKLLRSKRKTIYNRTAKTK